MNASKCSFLLLRAKPSARAALHCLRLVVLEHGAVSSLVLHNGRPLAILLPAVLGADFAQSESRLCLNRRHLLL